MFYDRAEAAEKLAKVLENYKGKKNALVLAMPRGGVVLGRIVAEKLGLPLDIVIARKIGAPGNPEYAIGAVAEKGEPILNDEVIGTMGITPDYLDKEIERKRNEISQRLISFRGNKPALDLKNKQIILIDDGIATGMTAIASIEYLRSQKPQKIILATPVIPADNLPEIKQKVDQLIYLEAPEEFFSVGQFYEEFPQVSDEEVKKLLSNY